MADNNDAKAKMLAALEAKKARQGGQRSGGAPQVQRKAGPSSSGSNG